MFLEPMKDSIERVKSLLDSMGVLYHTDSNALGDDTINVLVPDRAVGIDCIKNHEESYNPHSVVKGVLDRHHYRNKGLKAEAKGIKLLQFFEDEVADSWPIVESMIRNALGKSVRIMARKCEVKVIDSQTAKAFCDNNHINGYTKSKHQFGLFHDDQLVACMTFAASRFDKREGTWEVIRFCSLKGHVVMGGGSRLIKAAAEFITEMKTLITYADRMIGDGQSYAKMGFKQAPDVNAGYFWYDPSTGIRHHRQKFQKHRLGGVLKEFRPSETEDQNMYRHGYRKIFNAGYRKFEMECRSEPCDHHATLLTWF